jgi:hypothetical protein
MRYHQSAWAPVTITAYSFMVSVALAAAELLEQDGISAE